MAQRYKRSQRVRGREALQNPSMSLVAAEEDTIRLFASLLLRIEETTLALSGLNKSQKTGKQESVTEVLV